MILALKAVESVGGRELQTLEVYVRSIPMEKGFLALKQDFKHLSPYECGLGWAVAADKDFIGKKRRWPQGSIRNTDGRSGILQRVH